MLGFFNLFVCKLESSNNSWKSLTGVTDQKSCNVSQLTPYSISVVRAAMNALRCNPFINSRNCIGMKLVLCNGVISFIHSNSKLEFREYATSQSYHLKSW